MNLGEAFAELGIDLDGNGTSDELLHFYRLLGDFNGDRAVTSSPSPGSDMDLLNVAVGQLDASPFYDLTGDGKVNTQDRTKLTMLIGHALGVALPIDD